MGNKEERLDKAFMGFSGFSVDFASTTITDKTDPGDILSGGFLIFVRHLLMRRFICDHINSHAPAPHQIISTRVAPKP